MICYDRPGLNPVRINAGSSTDQFFIFGNTGLGTYSNDFGSFGACSHGPHSTIPPWLYWDGINGTGTYPENCNLVSLQIEKA